jgi:hypothetical protein
VTLPDGQTVRVIARGRVQQADGSWWYAVEIPLYAAVELGTVYRADPSPVEFLAPASACSPLPGEDYRALPTERPRRAPWGIEHRALGR